MSADPKAYARAAVLTGAMSLEPSPYDLLEVRVPPVRRTIANSAPPLDLTVLVIRYRQTGTSLEPVRPRHGRACGTHRRR